MIPKTQDLRPKTAHPSVGALVRRIVVHTSLVRILLLLSFAACVRPAAAETLLKNICHVKGQEENTLQGLGIVVGLKGTGDGGGFSPTMRTLAKLMTVMGTPMGKAGLADLKDSKNVAMVTVTVTIPAAGARQGDKLDCAVSSVGSAKSLAGGKGPTARIPACTPSLKVRSRSTAPRSSPAARSSRAAGWKKISSMSSARTAGSRWYWTSITPTFRSPRTWPSWSTAA